MSTPAARLYLDTAEAASALVIRRYSTSFGLASRLLGARERTQICNIYALVRVADEVVDGVASAAGLTSDQAGERLDDLERDLERAMATGYSTDLIVHAFASTARATGFGTELTRPFFASMRADLTEVEHDQASFDEYVYGSAEVVGLMCLAVFLHGRRMSDAQHARFVRGARALGAAFQKVNFLRDLSADLGSLGRSYFPGVTVSRFDEATKNRLLDDLDHDLDEAESSMMQLPKRSRGAVIAAHGLFAELSRRLRATPAADLITARVSVPTAVKARIFAGAAVRSAR